MKTQQPKARTRNHPDTPESPGVDLDSPPAMPPQIRDRPKRGKSRRTGRPRSALPADVAKKLGPAPLGQPLKLARWFTDAIAILTQLVMEGRPYITMLETVRASAGAAGRVIPHDIMYQAHAILKADADNMRVTSVGAVPVKRSDLPELQRIVAKIGEDDRIAHGEQRRKSTASRSVRRDID
jgi:hypothetical protein